MANLQAMLNVASMGLTGETLRVFIALMGSLDYENWVEVKQASLARRIGITPPQFNRGLKQLVEAGIVLKNPDAGSTKAYRVNPEYVWRGRGAKHREVINDFVKDRAKKARITHVITNE